MEGGGPDNAGRNIELGTLNNQIGGRCDCVAATYRTGVHVEVKPLLIRWWIDGFNSPSPHIVLNLGDQSRLGPLVLEVEIEPKTLNNIASVLRGNARAGQKMAQKIESYCEMSNVKKFKEKHNNCFITGGKIFARENRKYRPCKN